MDQQKMKILGKVIDRKHSQRTKKDRDILLWTTDTRVIRMIANRNRVQGSHLYAVLIQLPTSLIIQNQKTNAIDSSTKTITLILAIVTVNRDATAVYP